MGFSGKPSKACELCRSRRTKCDQQRPKCSQCVRKAADCIYRDLIDLAFRNENLVVVQKLQRGNPRTQSTASLRLTPGPGNAPLSSLTRCIQLGNGRVEIHALKFFMSNCAWGIHNDYVPILYKRQDCAPGFKSGVEAIGLATLSLARSEPGILDAARRSHLTAVKEVQQALISPTRAGRADTLASIMLLALFAAITSEPVAAHAEWTRHIRGAWALLQTRAHSNEDEDNVMNVLSSHVRGCVLVDCGQSYVETPKHFQKIKFEPRTPSSFQEKSEYVLDLMAALKHRRVTVETVDKTIQDLDIIDQELNDLYNMLPRVHPFRIDLQGFEGDNPPCHIYTSHKSARIWNIIRATRLNAYQLRHDKVLQMQHLAGKTLDQLKIDIGQQLQHASSSAALMVSEICASVPKFVRTARVGDNQQINDWAFSLLWPLSLARASPHAPEALRLFIRIQLQILWNITRFAVVDYHKHRLDEDVAPQTWTHVFFMT